VVGGGIGGADTSIGAPSGGNGVPPCRSAGIARGTVTATAIG
jgi:hypothetical protein